MGSNAPETKLTGVKLPVELRTAIEDAAKFYGVKMSPLIIRWLHDRATAEGWTAKGHADRDASQNKSRDKTQGATP